MASIQKDPSSKIGIFVLGASGSVGRALLRLIDDHSNDFECVGVTVHHARSWDRLLSDPRFSRQKLGFTGDPKTCQTKPQNHHQVLMGWEEIADHLAQHSPDVLAVACSGIEVLPMVYQAFRRGKVVWCANKEIWVAGGDLLAQACRSGGASLYPLDSEHQAIFDCMQGYRSNPTLPLKGGLAPYGFKRIGLFASGGPFWGWSDSQKSQVTPEQACHHPVWSMGRKISVDSATCMNKGLEIIEACHLFQLSPKEIQIIRHPEAVLHGMVEDLKGRQRILAAPPSMDFAIDAAFTWSRALFGIEEMKTRSPNPPSSARFSSFNLTAWPKWHFEEMEVHRVPALEMAVEAFHLGSAACCTFNAANEAAVHRFLNGQLNFNEITELVAHMMAKTPQPSFPWDDVEKIVQWHQACYAEAMTLKFRSSARLPCQ